MSKLNNFWQARFFDSVLKNAQHVIARSMKTAPSDEKELAEWRKGSRVRMTAVERYYVDIFYRVTNLNHVLDRLKQARHLIAKSPGTYLSPNSSLNRNDWADYHFYVYTTSLASILDCTLLITAEVLKLGLAPRHCTFDIVTQHDRLVGTKVVKALKSLKKTLEQHTQRRHRYVHRGEESSFSFLTDPDLSWRIRSVTFLADQGHFDISRQMLTRIWKLQIKEIQENLDKFEEDILQRASTVLECLLPMYDNYISSHNAPSEHSR